MKSPWLQTEFDLNAIPYLGGATTIQSNTEGIRKVLESSYSCFNTFGLHFQLTSHMVAMETKNNEKQSI